MSTKRGSTVELKYNKAALEATINTVWLPIDSDAIALNASNDATYFYYEPTYDGQTADLIQGQENYPSPSFALTHTGTGTINLSFLSVVEMQHYFLYTSLYPPKFYIDDSGRNSREAYDGRDKKIRQPEFSPFTKGQLDDLEIQKYIGYPVVIWFQYRSKLGLSYVNYGRINAWISGVSQDRRTIQLCKEDGSAIEQKSSEMQGVLDTDIVKWYPSDGSDNDPPRWFGADRNTFGDAVDAGKDDVLGHYFDSLPFFVMHSGLQIKNPVNKYSDPSDNTTEIKYPFKAIPPISEKNNINQLEISKNPNKILTSPNRTDSNGVKQWNFFDSRDQETETDNRMLLNEPQPNNSILYSYLKDTATAIVLASSVQPELIDNATGNVLSKSVHRIVLNVSDRTDMGLADMPLRLSSPLKPRFRIGNTGYNLIEIEEQDDETLIITLESV